MKVAIIGAGQVGQALARGFIAHGHEAKISSRDPDKLVDWVQGAGDGASAGTYAEAADFCDLACLCTPWSGSESAIEMIGPEKLAGKVVIDVTNPLVFEGDGPPTLGVGFDDSAGEQVQRLLPDSKVVKCFNIVGNPLMADPDLPGGPPTMYIAGEDDGAKETVLGILDDFGWESCDLGGIEMSRYLEPLAMVWIVQGARDGNFDQAFKMLRR
jgi:8-hydroxy-5-deazaflavin:NADPH oxidoreductase